MAYTVTNFKKKIDLKRAIESGARVSVFQPGPFGPNVPDGRCVLEGPHYPGCAYMVCELHGERWLHCW